MPYVSGFKNDIFISFSHADNTRGWINQFQDQLNNRLIQLGIEVTVWRDSKLSGTDVFSDEIFEQLQHSAFLITIVSPMGIKSHWCEDERQAFERFAALNGGFRFGNTLRAIKVVKTPLPDDQHRDLFGVTGFEFYKRETQSTRFYEFHDSSREFEHEVDRLAQSIETALNAFRVHLSALNSADKKKKTVYVAPTTPDLRSNRDAIVRELEVRGYAVIPRDPEPLRLVSSFRAVTKAELEVSILSVHLVSDQSQRIENEEDSIVGQYEIAQSALKDRIVWVDPRRQLYHEFEVALKNGLQNGVEILRTAEIENLKEVLGDKLKQSQREPPPPNTDPRVELYLLCDLEDHPRKDSDAGQRAFMVQQYLDDNGLLVMPPPFTEAEWNKLKEEYGEQLQVSDAVVLFWGVASEYWFLRTRRLIAQEQKRRSEISNARPLTEAFYFCSPQQGKSQYRSWAEFVFEQYSGFEPDALKPLLDRLLPP